MDLNYTHPLEDQSEGDTGGPQIGMGALNVPPQHLQYANSAAHVAALDYLVTLGRQQAPAVCVAHNLTSEIWLVRRDDGSIEEKTVPRSDSPLRVNLDTLDSLADYLKRFESDSEDYPTVVFVGRSQIIADLHHGAPVSERAYVPIAFCEAFAALLELETFVPQRTFWRALITDLHERIDPGLLMAISAISRQGKNAAAVAINLAGVADKNLGQSVTLTFNNGKEATESCPIQLDWTYRGPVYDCSNAEHALDLRLEINAEEGVALCLHPRAKERFLQTVRAALMAELQTLLADQPALLFVLGQPR